MLNLRTRLLGRSAFPDMSLTNLSGRRFVEDGALGSQNTGLGRPRYARWMSWYENRITLYPKYVDAVSAKADGMTIVMR